PDAAAVGQKGEVQAAVGGGAGPRAHGRGLAPLHMAVGVVDVAAVVVAAGVGRGDQVAVLVVGAVAAAVVGGRVRDAHAGAGTVRCGVAGVPGHVVADAVEADVAHGVRALVEVVRVVAVAHTGHVGIDEVGVPDAGVGVAGAGGEDGPGMGQKAVAK